MLIRGKNERTPRNQQTIADRHQLQIEKDIKERKSELNVH